MAHDAQSQDTAPPGGQVRHFLLGTAGHIDHGKTSLIRALTGTDTDRLPEEKARGMTIELGFASLEIGTTRFGVVDVPGHEKFVRTMVAGASGIDVALLVVAADDSVMPQTIEHVEILQLLGVSSVVVAVTKIDMVDEDMAALVADEVESLLAETSMTGSPIICVSSVTGEGLEELRSEIVKGAERSAMRPSSPPFHMAIDRVFTVAGRGTVVTGSVQRGRITEGDTLTILPSGRPCRVRDLQSHGSSEPQLSQSQRGAINLGGVDKDDVTRGDELASSGYVMPSRMVNTEISLLTSTGRALPSASIARMAMGTREVRVRVILADRASLAPGESCFAQLRAGEPLLGVNGRRFILRDENASRTIGGGVVLMPNPRRKLGDRELETLVTLRDGDAPSKMLAVLRLAGFEPPDQLRLAAMTGVDLEEIPSLLETLQKKGEFKKVPGTSHAVVPSVLDDTGTLVAGRLARWHREHPELPGRPMEAIIGWIERLAGKTLAKPVADHLIKKKVLKTFGRFVCHPEFAPTLTGADEKIFDAIIAELRDAGPRPKALDKLASAQKIEKKRTRRLADLAVAMGLLVHIDGDTYMDYDADQALRRILTDMIRESGGVTVASFRERIESSRKHVVPYLEFLDREKFTKRQGDERVLTNDVS
ncbi:MAG: selenocysteine-specific translation elongation factor [Phycisphaerae bacterium]